jgi:hypothetical protein
VRALPIVLVLTGSCFYVSEDERRARFDLDGDGALRPDDCDDADPTLAALTVWYADADGDGFGDPDTVEAACGAPPGFVADATDCDDTSAASHPGAPEVCDGLDDDCDELTDEDLGEFSWWPDADDDGFGDAGADPVESCQILDGYVIAADGDDCDDGDPDVNPDATEVCGNAVDEDCDQQLDNGC